jgi:DNA sulfur modification protein DndB
MMMNKTSPMLQVPATRGQMGSTTFYTANFPIGMVVKLFSFDPDEMTSIPVEQRHQRALKRNRIPEIKSYILDHDNYLFSSITVSVDSDHLSFGPSELDENLGMLSLPMDAEWIVNDGQHRVAGLADAMKEDPGLRYDSLSVVILPDEGLERAQQVFSDLNRTVQKTSKSLDILFDHRLPINRITTTCADRVRLFKGRIDKENVSLSIRSGQFATLSGLQAASAQLLGEIPEDISDGLFLALEDRAVEFWELMTDVIEPWSDIANGATSPADARADYLSSYALAMWAIGAAGHTAIKAAAGGDWQTPVSKLTDVNWLKSNPDWQGICMLGGDVITRVPTRKATADFLRWKIGLGEEPDPVVG